MSDLILDDFYGLEEINASLAQVTLHTLLEEEEELLWSSQPRQGLFRQAWDLQMIFNGVLWMSMPLYMFVLTIPYFMAGNAPNFVMWLVFPVLLLIFFLGWQTSIGQYLSQAKQRQKSFYGLTATALLIIDQETSTRIPLKKVIQPNIERKNEHYGHLQFKFPLHQLPGTNQTFTKGISLKWMPNIERLEDILHKAQQDHLR